LFSLFLKLIRQKEDKKRLSYVVYGLILAVVIMGVVTLTTSWMAITLYGPGKADDNGMLVNHNGQMLSTGPPTKIYQGADELFNYPLNIYTHLYIEYTTPERETGEIAMDIERAELNTKGQISFYGGGGYVSAEQIDDGIAIVVNGLEVYPDSVNVEVLNEFTPRRRLVFDSFMTRTDY